MPVQQRRALRILFTLPWARRSGGAEEMLRGLIEGGAAHGYECELVFLEDGPWPAQLRAEGVRAWVLPTGRVRQPQVWIPAIVRLAGLMRSRRPDLIVNWAAKPQLYGAPAAALAGMADRVIWWQHAIPKGHWIDRIAAALPARAIGATAAAAVQAQRRIRPRRPMFVVHAGVPAPAPAPPVQLELPAGVPVVGLVGRLQPWKGQDRLLRAHALLRARGRRLHLLLVGGDSFDLAPAYTRALPALVDSLGLSGEVTMTGEVPDAGPYIERMDVLVNASDAEPFGIVLLEGMARGVPVVAVDAGGPREIVLDGSTGVLARSPEPQALADALEPLLDSEQLRRRLGEAGRARYEAQFTLDAMCARFAAAARELAAGRIPSS